LLSYAERAARGGIGLGKRGGRVNGIDEGKTSSALLGGVDGLRLSRRKKKDVGGKGIPIKKPCNSPLGWGKTEEGWLT